MELSVVTPQDAEDSIHERLLLHWVNSLPLTKCLLVEELRELRFGDVLVEIVQWLQGRHNSTDADHCEEVSGGDALDQFKITERLRRVVQFTAGECRSQDGDAMYVVNDAECLARLLAGESDTICAVLTVLRRLNRQRSQENQLSENDKDVLWRRCVQEQMIENALHQEQTSEKLPRELDNVLLKQKSKRVRSAPSRSRPSIKPFKDDTEMDTTLRNSRATNQSKKKPKPTKRGLRCKRSATLATASKTDERKKVSDRISDGNELRTFGMLDPSAKIRERSSIQGVDDSRAKCFCNWARHVLEIEMPLDHIFTKQSEIWKLQSPRKIGMTFANGIVLRRIATALVVRCGEQLKYSTAAAKDLNFPASNDLHTPTEKRRNFTFALAVFKDLGVSPEALALFESMQRTTKKTSTQAIWNALDEVMSQAERRFRAPRSEETLETREKDKNASRHVKKLSPKTQHIGRKSIEVKTTVNGLTGCAPLNRSLPYITSEQMNVVNKWLIDVGFDGKKVSGRGVLQDPMRNGVLLCALNQQVKDASFSYFKTPRTLMEMRENISKAFERLRDLKIPLCYLTSSAEQAVLTGDRQIIYGILWHLWQARGFTGLDESRMVQSVGLDRETVVPFKPSPLLLDIPAVALAGKGKFAMNDPYQVELHDTFARRLAWSESTPISDHYDDDDVFPVPKAPFSSPTYDDGLKGKQVRAGVFPIRAGTSGSAQISNLAYQKPPSIALGELSVDVAALTEAYNDLVQLQDRKNYDSVQEPSPVKVSQSRGKALQEPVGEILEWLNRLGIRLKNTSAFHDSKSNLTEFQSGVLLCCIIEKVEFMRSIPGITRPSGKQPLSKASALHNITKALNILQQKKTMPLHLLRRANAIYTGNRDVILQLLGQIRKAYGHHHAPRRRPKQHISIAA
ncbi:hypothetical protein V7S43_005408 [Phytophthora oleae]|uniref:Calponin-homology (CH) domain-containing protein n=1 Tax=Phytophthora oleae TaxID=2107226 RepID=A0ABD3FT32_9STRA